jgi:hypothetical protein
MRMPPQRLKGPQQQPDQPCVSKSAKKRASAVVSRTIASGLRLALRFPVDVGDLHLAADGKTIALCLEDKSVRVFDVASGNQVGVYTIFVAHKQHMVMLQSFVYLTHATVLPCHLYIAGAVLDRRQYTSRRRGWLLGA